jgi:hypothetical protein
MISRKYIFWMALNSWAVSTSNTISVNSMLNSIGSNSAFSNMTIAYIGKDIIGQTGALFYANQTGKKADKEPKKYILKGAFFQQASFFIENCSVFLTNTKFILPFLGFSSLLKNISFISIGAVNINNLKKIAEKQTGEFYTKVASINSLSSSLGMICGMGIVYALPSYTLRTIVILPILGIISVYSLSKATRLCSYLK